MRNLLFVFLVSILVVSCGGKDDVPAPVETPVGPGPVKFFRVKIGTPAKAGMSYSWFPADSLDNANVAQPMASPKKTTTYTVTATSKCGQASSHMVVKVFRINDEGQLEEVTE